MLGGYFLVAKHSGCYETQGHALVLGHAPFSIILVIMTEQNAPPLRSVYGLDWPFGAYYHFAIC